MHVQVSPRRLIFKRWRRRRKEEEDDDDDDDNDNEDEEDVYPPGRAY